MIPEAAVDAALDELPIEAARFFNKARMRNILEAAVPHMLAEAWEAGANAAWERSTPAVNGQYWQWRSAGDPINPYI